MLSIQKTMKKTCVAGILLASLGAHAGPLRPAALTGTDGPLGPGLGAGVTFTSFTVSDLVSLDKGWPSINGAGQSVFFGTLGGPGIDSTNDRGIWAERNGHLELIARVGDHAPGTEAGVVYSKFFRQPTISDAGTVAFMGFVEGLGVTNDNNEAIWFEDPGSGALSLFIRENDTPLPDGSGFFANPQAPGQAGNTIFGGQLRINRLGQVAAVALTTQTPPANNNFPVHGIYSNRNGALEEVVRVGTPIPNSNPPVDFWATANYSMSDDGTIAFDSISGVPAPQFYGTWTEHNGTIRSVAQTGDPAPGTTLPFDQFFFNPGINSSDRVAFMGYIPDPELFLAGGIWSEGTFGVLQPIAICGSPAPGTSHVFFDFEAPVVSDDGTTAFVGTFNSFSLNRGVWSNRTGLLDAVAVSGQHVPSIPNMVFVDFFSLSLNASGESSFFATTSLGKVTCAQDPAGVLQTIAGTFSPLDLFGDGSDVRLLTDIITPIRAFSLDEVASATGDGRRSHFNDAGDVSFRVVFDGGTSEAIMTTSPAQTPPCPADLTGDGALNFFDVSAFLAAFSAGDPIADFTNDGQFNFFDVSAFLSAFSAGCP